MKANQNGYNPQRTRQQLGLDKTAAETLLSPRKPTPIIEDGSIWSVLTHTGVFSPEDCEKVLNDNASKGFAQAAVQTSVQEDTPVEKLQVRDSGNIWLEKNDDNLWMFDKMLALIMSANKIYKFEVDYFEALQLVQYNEGQFYDWHCDLGAAHMGNRKLSVTLQLSDPDSYEGGDLVLDENGSDFVAPRELGSVTVFPSFLKHKVTPVTKGTRHSLVVWASGTNRFR